MPPKWPKFVYLGLINNAILTTTYLEQLRIPKVPVFNTSAMLTARIEALQFAFRAKLDHHAQTLTDKVELATDFMIDV